MQTTKTITYLDHRTYGGVILESDFYTCHPTGKYEIRSRRADRISHDHSFDSWCQNYKNKFATRFKERLIRTNE